eukprot:scaffold3353_cov298-Chaetoceros_neogracile.AAC.4
MAQTVSTSNDDFATLNDKGDSVGGDRGAKAAVLDGTATSTKRGGVTAMEKRTGAGAGAGMVVVFIGRQRKSNVIPTMSGFAFTTTDEDTTRKNCILDSSTSRGAGRRIRADNGGSERSGRREGAMKAQWTVSGNGGKRVIGIGMKRMVVGRWDRNSMFTMLVTAGVFFFLSQSVSLAEAMEISSNVEDDTSTLKLHHISDEIPIVPDVTGIESISDDVLKKGDFLLLESKEAGTASAGTVAYEKVTLIGTCDCTNGVKESHISHLAGFYNSGYVIGIARVSDCLTTTCAAESNQEGQGNSVMYTIEGTVVLVDKDSSTDISTVQLLSAIQKYAVSIVEEVAREAKIGFFNAGPIIAMSESMVFLSDLPFDSPPQNFCLAVKNIHMNAKFYMRPCGSLTKQSNKKLWSFDHKGQIRNTNNPQWCMAWAGGKKKKLWLEKCDTRRKTASFEYVKSQKAIVVTNTKNDKKFLIGFNTWKKYGKLRLYGVKSKNRSVSSFLMMVVPTHVLSDAPSALPSGEPTLPPSPMPSDLPSKQPTPSPTAKPTPSPTAKPTPSPTAKPSRKPTPSYPNCNVGYPVLIGNGVCQGGDYNTAECGSDGGDCDDFNLAYPHCNVDRPYSIGNGSCSGVDYNTAECGFDGGDCVVPDYPDCHVDRPSNVGNGWCDNYGKYNTAECGSDGGDCDDFNEAYPHCNAGNPGWIGNGFCNGGDYNTEACGFDEGDCSS